MEVGEEGILPELISEAVILAWPEGVEVGVGFLPGQEGVEVGSVDWLTISGAAAV